MKVKSAVTLSMVLTNSLIASEMLEIEYPEYVWMSKHKSKDNQNNCCAEFKCPVFESQQVAFDYYANNTQDELTYVSSDLVKPISAKCSDYLSFPYYAYPVIYYGNACQQILQTYACSLDASDFVKQVNGSLYQYNICYYVNSSSSFYQNSRQDLSKKESEQLQM